MRWKLLSFCLFLVFGALMATAEDNPAGKELPVRVSGLPALHLDARLNWYLLQRSDFQRRHNLVGALLLVEPVWVGFNNRLYVGSLFDVVPTMGKQMEGVIFDPIDINFSLSPYVEYRFPLLSVRAGLEHRCFHEIDRKDFQTIYWNYISVGAASENIHEECFLRSFIESAHGGWQTRFAWQAQWGWFLKEFFTIQSSNVNYMNFNIQELRLQGRFGLARWRTLYIALQGATRWGTYQQKPQPLRTYWRQTLGVDAGHFRQGRGMCWFFNYILDDMPPDNNQPRFTQHGLLEAGVKVVR